MIIDTCILSFSLLDIVILAWHAVLLNIGVILGGKNIKHVFQAYKCSNTVDFKFPFSHNNI